MTAPSRFLESIKCKTDRFHEERLAQIDGFDYSKVLAKVSRDAGGLTDRYLEEGELALKQYYAVALLDPLNEHAVSAVVDPFWHSHVLFSKDYSGFCRSIYGGYVHHSPLDPNDSAEVKRVAKLYEYTLKTYERIFSEMDKNWWPALGSEIKFGSRGPVCLHQLIQDPEIVAHAVFPEAGPDKMA